MSALLIIQVKMKVSYCPKPDPRTSVTFNDLRITEGKVIVNEKSTFNMFSIQGYSYHR
jgi:hypothetical protein